MSALSRCPLPVCFGVAAFVVWAHCQSPTAFSQQDAALRHPEIEDVQVGFDGKYKVGHWTPVRVTIRGGGQPARGHVDVRVPDGEGVESLITREPTRPVEIPPDLRTTVMLYVKFGRVHGDLAVDVLLEDGGRISRKVPSGELPPGVLATQQLIVVVGADVGTADAVLRRPRKPSEAIVTAVVADVRGLPDHWLGFSGVDALVLATGNLTAVEEFGQRRLSALRQWVCLGGRLLLCVGSHGEQLLGDGGVLTTLAPGRFAQMTRLTESPRMESYAGASVRLGSSGHDDGHTRNIAVTVLTDVQGEVAVEERGQRRPYPLIIRAARGLGQVIFCAFDLDQPPIASWSDRERLVARLLDLLLGGPAEGIVGQKRGQVSHVGFEDLTGQLRAALDQFPGVTLVPFALIVTVAVLFIAVIGPADYFLLHKGLGRVGWTWLTFPASVAAICATSYYLAYRWKGSERRVNQVDLVDVDVESGCVRGTCWAHVFSPRTESFDLSIQPLVPEPEPNREVGRALSWQGLAGESFGGMNTSTTPTFGSTRYSIIEAAAGNGDLAIGLEDFPVQIWSSRSLIGQWWSKWDPGEVSLLSANQDGLLKGEITNPLAQSLEDCTLLHGRWAYPLGELRPRSTVQVVGQPRNVEWLLTQRRIVETRDVTTPWDQRGFDVPRIMQMIMFHDAAGGQVYTELLHRFQRSLDMSDHLRIGRAILVGRSKAPASRLTRREGPLADHEQHWTFYRIVFPVGASGH